MILYIIRHAWAGERDAARWPDDDQRPLTDDGRKRFGKQLKKMPSALFAPVVVATSPLVRCRQTAELVAKHLALPTPLVPLDALAPGSDLAELMAWTASQQAERIAWVGHAPDVSTLAAALIGEERAALRFGKGAIAAIEFDGAITVGQGELLWLASAKLWGV